MENECIYLGIGGSVAAIEKLTGKEIWRTTLKSSRYVVLVVEERLIFAYTSGHLFALDRVNGNVLWENGLKGLGYGMGILATQGATSDVAAIIQQIKEAQEAASN